MKLDAKGKHYETQYRKAKKERDMLLEVVRYYGDKDIEHLIDNDLGQIEIGNFRIGKKARAVLKILGELGEME